MNKKRLITWLTAAYIALLTTLCLVKLSVPSPNVPGIGFDKVVHFCFYAGLNTLLISTIIAHKAKATTKHIIITTLAAIVYGVAIEFIQGQVGRDFDISDIAANSIGAISAAIIISLLQINSRLNRYIRE